MVFSLPSLRETMQDYRSSLFLAEKYHVMAKEEKVYNVQMYQLEQQLCYSFEKDLRDKRREEKARKDRESAPPASTSQSSVGSSTQASAVAVSPCNHTVPRKPSSDRSD